VLGHDSSTGGPWLVDGAVGFEFGARQGFLVEDTLGVMLVRSAEGTTTACIWPGDGSPTGALAHNVTSGLETRSELRDIMDLVVGEPLGLILGESLWLAL
jgi:hypothetical protein